ncbi:MAG: aminotransferase class V-fold PLP-dependent enzyme [Acidimicrobiales bacterium]|nr:aminotransferase class V-fold PLP-dependent enzyme [Acidimicrobiales bacterium]
MDTGGATPEIYLDHAASTPVRPEARDAWLAATDTHHANPTGSHKAARAARRALDDARDAVAAALGRPPAELIFTSGGSEADNLAVRGVLAARGGVAVCSAGEHHAVLEPVEHAGGVTVGLDETGRVAPDDLADLLDGRDDVSIVSLIAVNNETGAVNDLPALAAVVRDHAPGALIHTDAVQALSWVDVAEVAADADLVSITGHKVGGPIGTGALFVRQGVELGAQILGGGQERGRRAGTPDVAGAAAFAAAVEATVERRESEVARLGALRDRLIAGLVDELGDVVTPTIARPGDVARVAAGIAHVILADIEAEALLFLLDQQGIRASAASSCSSGAQDPSHVLAAMGVPREVAQGSLRLSLGWTSTEADVDAALAIIPDAVHHLRAHGGG